MFQFLQFLLAFLKEISAHTLFKRLWGEWPFQSKYMRLSKFSVSCLKVRKRLIQARAYCIQSWEFFSPATPGRIFYHSARFPLLRNIVHDLRALLEDGTLKTESELVGEIFDTDGEQHRKRYLHSSSTVSISLRAYGRYSPRKKSSIHE